MAAWLETTAGLYLHEWEQAQVDALVADLFGFHAVQLGLRGIDGLRANRMPHRWLALDAAPRGEAEAPAGGAAVALRCDFDALPFATRSLDLVVLPHTLELARDPHRALAEVDRVLRPEGRVVILGFNPASLWGLRQRAGRLARRLRVRRGRPLFLPATGELIGYRRLRDWLRLLSFEVEASRFGGYGWPVNRERWLARDSWIERAGDRWWPVFGAVYALVAVKRVRGMRLVGLVRTQPAAAQQTLAALAGRARPHHHQQDPTP